MKPIKTKFSAEGHYLQQIWRDREVAVYARSLSPEHDPHELEMVVIKLVPETMKSFGGPSQIIEEHETYPSPSQWGRLGWSFPIKEKAWVLNLASQCCGIVEDRAGFVRSETHRKWKELNGTK